MRFTEFRDSIRNELKDHSAGVTWASLQARLGLPYSSRPCPDSTKRLEEEIGSRRIKAGGRAMIWTLTAGDQGSRRT